MDPTAQLAESVQRLVALMEADERRRQDAERALSDSSRMWQLEGARSMAERQRDTARSDAAFYRRLYWCLIACVWIFVIVPRMLATISDGDEGE